MIFVEYYNLKTGLTQPVFIWPFPNRGKSEKCRKLWYCVTAWTRKLILSTKVRLIKINLFPVSAYYPQPSNICPNNNSIFFYFFLFSAFYYLKVLKLEIIKSINSLFSKIQTFNYHETLSRASRPLTTLNRWPFEEESLVFSFFIDFISGTQ